MKNGGIVMTQQAPTQTSLVKAFNIIEVLKNGETGLLDIAKKVEQNKTTVHRILNTMIQLGYIRQNQENQKYQLSLKFVELGNSVLNRFDIVALAKPFIRALSESVNEVVHLVTIDGSDIVYIDKIEAENAIRMHSYIGKRIPLYCTAVGKAYLANLDEAERAETLKSIEMPEEKYTPNTITDIEEYKAVLERAKVEGFAMDNEEFELGVICVAAPIFSYDGKIRHAISISTPKMRMNDEKLEVFSEKVKETAGEISRELGYGV